MPDPIRRNLTLAQLNASAPLNLVPSDAKVVGVPGTGDPLGPDPLGASLEGAKHVYQTYAGLLTIGAVNEAKALRKVIPESWIRAFHGSPYDFDKFDLSKIGTGEGAQAYGHGLYFAENPQVAADYRKNLAAGIVQRVGNEPYDSARPEHLAASLIDTFSKVDPNPRAVAMKELAHDIANPALTDAMRQKYQATYELLKSSASLPTMTREPAGRMYEVAIHASPEQLLDWDKPLSQQSEAVRQAITKLPERMRTLRDPVTGELAPQYGEPFGREVYQKIGSAPHATGVLKAEGVKGLQYLDQGSRASGQGTKNYVIFDASIVDILKKYGLLLPAAKTLQQLNAPPEQGQ